MSLTCKDLLSLNSFHSIRLIAGKKGLDRVITYPYTCVTTSIADWVHGGELVFIINSTHSAEQLPKLLQECILENMAGLIIVNDKDCPRKVPQELITMADDANFPLFSMPWDLHIVDVTKEITDAMNDERSKTNKALTPLNQLIFETNNNSLRIIESEALATLNIHDYYFIAIFTTYNEASLINNTQENLLYDYLNKTESISYNSFLDKNNLILLVSSYSSEELENVINHFEKISDNPEFNHYDNRLLLAIGDIHEGTEKIYTSYQEAVATMTTVKKIGFKNLCRCRYKDLGVHRLLLQMKHSDMECYANNQLGALIDYEKKNGDELLPTLKTYLKSFNNISQASKTLVVHRNTLLYRLKKIEKVLGRSLKDPMVCIELLLALLIMRYLE